MAGPGRGWNVRAGRLTIGLAVAVVVLVSAGHVSGQFGGRTISMRLAPPDMPDGDFTICRIMYDSVRSVGASGGGWRTDYPLGETNLMIRFSELTRTRVSTDAGRRPNHWVVRLTDDALFNCPYAVASDVGTMGLTSLEAERLRVYLLKGGFLWVDDFWGSLAWVYWAEQMRAVFPDRPIEDVPLSDPIFSAQFVVKEMPQIPRLPFWRQTGSTSELGEDSRDARLRAIRDDRGRIMILMTHNNDIADSWEREGDDPDYFRTFSPNGYGLGINVLLHALTH